MESAFRPRSDYKSPIDSGGSGYQLDTQRPPVYNAEDYTGYLQKYCKLTGLQLYLHTGPSGQRQGDGGGGKTNKSKLLLGKRTEKNDSPGLFDKHQIEMGLKQFTSISELLNKLKIDLTRLYKYKSHPSLNSRNQVGGQVQLRSVKLEGNEALVLEVI